MKIIATYERIRDIEKWIQKVTLSKRITKIKKTLSDGVLVAEIIKHYLPNLVNMHNYTFCSSKSNKKVNWECLNYKVLWKLHIKQTNQEIEAIIDQKPYIIEQFQVQLRHKIEEVLKGDIKLLRNNSKSRVIESLKSTSSRNSSLNKIRDTLRSSSSRSNSKGTPKKKLEDFFTNKAYNRKQKDLRQTISPIKQKEDIVLKRSPSKNNLFKSPKSNKSEIKEKSMSLSCTRTKLYKHDDHFIMPRKSCDFTFSLVSEEESEHFVSKKDCENQFENDPKVKPLKTKVQELEQKLRKIEHQNVVKDSKIKILETLAVKLELNLYDFFFSK